MFARMGRLRRKWSVATLRAMLKSQVENFATSRR